MSLEETGVSVIIAAYNAAATLENTVRTVLAQTHPFLEIIIIDDRSKDNTLDIAKNLVKADSRIKVISAEKNGGPAAARNLGLDSANGKWVAVVDSDDEILPQRFATMLTATNDDIDIVFDNLCYITVPDMHERPYIPTSFDGFGPLGLETFILSHRRSVDIPNLGFLKPLIRRSAIENNNIRYKTDLKIGEDAMLIMDLMARGAKAVLLPDVLYRYFRHAGSISAVQSRESIAAINQSYEDFLDRYYGELEAGVVRAMRELINDNKRRIAADEIASDMCSFRLGSAVRELTGDVSLSIPVAKNIAGRLKRTLRGSR